MQEMVLTLSGTPDFTPFVEFLSHDLSHSLYMHYIICQYEDYVYGLMTGLFAWISLTALSRTYLIDMMCTYCQHRVLLSYMYRTCYSRM